MKKKIIFAILMAGLMLVTVFSAVSVNAVSVNRTEDAAENLEKSELTERVTLTARVYKDENGNGKKDLTESWDSGAKIVVVNHYETGEPSDNLFIYPRFISCNALGYATADVLPGYEYTLSAINGFKWTKTYEVITISEQGYYDELGLTKKTVSKTLIRTPLIQILAQLPQLPIFEKLMTLQP